MSAIVTCPNCGKKNRVPAAASGYPRCGVCKSAVPWIVDAGDADFAEVVEQIRWSRDGSGPRPPCAWLRLRCRRLPPVSAQRKDSSYRPQLVFVTMTGTRDVVAPISRPVQGRVTVVRQSHRGLDPRNCKSRPPGRCG